MISIRHLRWIAAAVVTLTAMLPVASLAQSVEEPSAWQVEKCAMYQQGWDKALDFFGTDNLNYAFIAQNENFIASGCTAPPSICAQSSQELEIANALTIVMMNGGAASTFLPFRCQDDLQPRPIGNVTGPAPDSQLCRAQLDLLVRGNKLTVAEAAVYEAQCDCLEQNQQAGAQTDCAQ